ncbi:MAG TPA: ABC transporter ATP-binding protein [Pseudolabrys sp.]|nr:ABC transporter ATP-binding protein [Pseudolabrys sp.]
MTEAPRRDGDVNTQGDLLFSCSGVSVALPHTLGERKVLDDISFDVRHGEVFTIVGPSGTGKTTLLRVLGGLTRATTGSVRINGRELTGPPEEVVIVFQDYSHALLQWRTVARNVALGLERREDADEIKRRVGDALRLVKLEKNADDYPWQLSGGMQQRVQIARALAVRPSVLLMDEPFAALDAMTKASLQDELLGVRDQTGTSIVFVTHDIEEAVYLGDRIAVITGSPGRITHTFDIDLRKPRDQVATRQMPAFLEFRYAVHQAIGSNAYG